MYFILILICFCSTVYGESVYILIDEYFWITPSFYDDIQTTFDEQGTDVKIVNWANIKNNSDFYDEFNRHDVNYVLLLSYKKHLDELYFQMVPKNKRAIVIFEPPVVFPGHYTQKFFKKFGKIFTFADCYVDNIKFFKFRYPSCLPMIDQTTPFDERKLACLINANKSWKHPLDLTSKRREVVNFYETKPKGIFDLYGSGWPDKLKNYQGKSENKIETTKKYKFCYCFENTKEVAGYVTEKIFDCFRAGIVPIYYGAPNISDEIPRECYIDFREYSSINDLHEHISKMDETTFNLYIRNIENYLNGDSSKKYTLRAFAESISQALQK